MNQFVYDMSANSKKSIRTQGDIFKCLVLSNQQAKLKDIPFKSMEYSGHHLISFLEK